MTFKVETETLFPPYVNEAHNNVRAPCAKADMTLNAADTMLLQRISDLAQIRQSQILQSQDDGWFMNRPSIEGQFVGNMGGVNSSKPLASNGFSNTVGSAGQECEDDNEYVESDLDGASDMKAEAPEMKHHIVDEEKDARASPHQRPHAAVEKRYRRTVNTKLQQLYMSIPASGKFSPDDRAGTGSDEGDQAAKPVVLDKAIQYVQHLTETYLKYDADIEDLRQQLRDLADRHGISEHTLQPQSEEQPSDMA